MPAECVEVVYSDDRGQHFFCGAELADHCPVTRECRCGRVHGHPFRKAAQRLTDDEFWKLHTLRVERPFPRRGEWDFDLDGIRWLNEHYDSILATIAHYRRLALNLTVGKSVGDPLALGEDEEVDEAQQ